MKKIGYMLMVLAILFLAGCAGVTEGQVGTSPSRNIYTNPNWGTDATCAPVCPAGQGEGW